MRLSKQRIKAGMNSPFVDFETCQTFAQEANITSRREWNEASSKGLLPDCVPGDPASYYSKPPVVLIPLEELKQQVQKYGIKSQSEYKEAKAKKILPDTMPGVKTLYDRYKDHGWKGFGDFLGTGRIPDIYKRKLIFKDFKTCRAFVRKLKLENAERWYEFARSGKKPEWIPSHPNRVYREWISFSDWIGRPNKYDKWTYEQSKKWIRNSGLNIKTKKEFMELRKAGVIPQEIPALPLKYYGGKK